MRQFVAAVAVLAAAWSAIGQAQRGAAADPDKNMANGGVKVAGWQARLDLPNQRVENLSFAPMGTGMHATTGPAAIFWKPDQTASGPYMKATSALAKLRSIRKRTACSLAAPTSPARDRSTRIFSCGKTART